MRGEFGGIKGGETRGIFICCHRQRPSSRNLVVTFHYNGGARGYIFCAARNEIAASAKPSLSSYSSSAPLFARTLAQHYRLYIEGNPEFFFLTELSPIAYLDLDLHVGSTRIRKGPVAAQKKKEKQMICRTKQKTQFRIGQSPRDPDVRRRPGHHETIHGKNGLRVLQLSSLSNYTSRWNLLTYFVVVFVVSNQLRVSCKQPRFFLKKKTFSFCCYFFSS